MDFSYYLSVIGVLIGQNLAEQRALITLIRSIFVKGKLTICLELGNGGPFVCLRLKGRELESQPEHNRVVSGQKDT